MSDNIKQYPRVLIVNGEPFNLNSATGITLNNLFYKWPRERIAMIYTANILPNSDICKRYWRLRLSDLYIVNNISRIKRNIFYLNKIAAQIGPRHNKIISTDKTSGSAGERSIVRSILRAFSDLLPYNLSAEILNWMDDFSPEIVYTYLGDIRLTDLAIRISERYNIPAVPHFMDDWIATMYNSSCIFFLQRRLLLRKVQKLFKKVPLGMSISEIMAHEYSNRFLCRFETFMNTVPVSSEIETLTLHRRLKDPVRFCYVGGLHLSRWKSLIKIVSALEHLSKEGKCVEMSIYAPNTDTQRYKSFFSYYGVVKYMGSVSSEEVPTILLKADVLIHVESFDEHIRKCTRLSLSTKIPQYMASGRPILALAPMEVASSQYISKIGCGIVIGQNDEKAIENALLELIINPDLMDHLGRLGWQAALRNHNSTEERERFRSVLAEAVNTNSQLPRDAGVSI